MTDDPPPPHCGDRVTAERLPTAAEHRARYVLLDGVWR